MRIDFFIVGSMKSGTTSLYDTLKNHPDVSMSSVKEPGHFLLEENYNLISPLFEAHWWSLDSYNSLFQSDKLCGEASTSYTMPPFTAGIARRIYEYNPAAKIIYIVRNPLDRAISHYNFTIRHRKNQPPIAQAIVMRSDYLGMGDYAAQLKCYRDYFSPDDILVLISERFRADYISGVRQVETFLEISSMADPERAESNVTPDKLAAPRIPHLALDRMRGSGLRKAFRALTPEVALGLARTLLHTRPVAKATRTDVPEAVVEHLARRAKEFRELIDDPIPEWDI